MKKRTYEIWKRHADRPDKYRESFDTKYEALHWLTEIYGDGFYLVEVVRTRVQKSKKDNK